ncbi:type IV pilus assembly PilZ [Candidatus Koribacter versatilis Ellin345]|uniref:Type IV pilus assembly PilZ n=1 Tax=Koribacter versatilis (strain Ellin345) TaxID=204669 RepID=Q1IM06_KORVE|nr:PilZ domain-containing protein [Candidatus Koribacter versatilis]ABF42094.1 type IV pilus assembly PilZ [Candidatus Koribacter versatilis Ellin345]
MPVNVLVCGTTAEAQLVREGLANLGIDSFACADAGAALARLRRRKYAAIVVDTSAESMGNGFLTTIRELPSTRSSIVIAVSSAEESRLSFKRGANLVLEQPLSDSSIARGLRVAHSLMLREQDRYRRLKVDLPANIDVGGGRVTEASVANLSEGGMAIQLPCQVASGTAIGWALNLPGESKHLAGIGNVVWSDDTGKAGVMFTGLTGSDKEMLSRWLRRQ